MKCPVDDAPLTMSERSGIEIDYCPTCRGVWLDRGELDKLIDRSNSGPAMGRSEQSYRKPDARPYESPRRDYQSHDEYANKQSHHKKKRDSFLGDLFDF